MKKLFAFSVVAIMTLGLWTSVEAQQPPCTPEVNGACFIPLAAPPDSIAFQLFDGETGWLLTVTYMGLNNWLQLLPNQTARVHVDDHDAILGAFNVFTGDIAGGLGRASANLFFDVAAGLVLCPGVITVSGDLEGRRVDAHVQTTRGNANSPPLGPPPQDGCFLKENFVRVD